MILATSAAFQSTFPRGERRKIQGILLRKRHFNPRSLVGNDWGAREIRAKRSISIHVPSWGTTLDGWKKSCADVKFQSTFPRGERHESSDTGPLPFKFQSTFPRGERHGRGSGCTLRSYFNPRSLVGNDWLPVSFPETRSNFNPRSLVGNDNIVTLLMESFEYFNPRSLVGNDGERGLSG